MLTSRAISEFIKSKLHSVFVTEIVFVSRPFEDRGSWAIVHGTADNVMLRRFKTLEDATDEFSATQLLRVWEGRSRRFSCEVDVAASVRLLAR
jgi:hypothetical protein